MQPIEPTFLAQVLQGFEGERVYLHFEFCRGGFVRNVTAAVVEARVRGSGPYRVALRLADDGWVIMEGLTHMAAGEGADLFLAAMEEDQRLASALQINREAFSA